MSLRLADLADARVAIWGCGREGHAALAALRRYFPHKPLTVFCNDAEARELIGHAAAALATAPRAHGRNATTRSPGASDRGEGVTNPSPPIASGERVGVRGKHATSAVAPHDEVPRPHPILSPSAGAGGAGSDPDPRDAHLNIVTAPPTVEALSQFDVVVKSPGISPYTLPAAAVLRAGVRFTSGSALWFAERPHARTICVTGTKGKSTVAALIAHLLRQSGQCIALAGNIGLPLLELLAPARGDPVASIPDWWVIELSSFQTHDFAGAPTVAVVNNLYEEHLDWHGTRERYVADKLAIAAHASRLVVHAQAELLERTATHPDRRVSGDGDGWHVRDAAVWRGGERLLALQALPLPGTHNALNVCAALTAIEAAGFDAAALLAHARSFQPLPHRLQRLGTRAGIDYVNDSIATTPYATIEALRSLDGRSVTVLVGGFDRGIDWQPFVDHACVDAPHAVVTMGANGPAITAALQGIAGRRFDLVAAGTLDEAMRHARALTPAGGTILLSPGAPSFDQFHDYAERGREFARLAGFDPAAIVQIEGLGVG